MNNEQTLLQLGFIRFPDWDYKEIGADHYRLDKSDKVFRAYVMHHNPPTYVIIGEVTTPCGIVKRWKDCVSIDSVARFINKSTV